MYKIIIVDDEADVRRGIIGKINFNEMGYKLVGEAENGVEALEVIERENPDLAIIDIKMPYMDGIELASQVYDKYPAVKVIILSGFDEFEFAQQAIRYNVMDYVLKPITSQDVVDLLQKTKKKLDEEKHKRRDIQALEKHYLESLPIIRERFLNALVLEKHGVYSLNDKLKRFNIHIGSGDYLIAIVSPDQSKNVEDAVFDLHAYSIYETCKSIVKDRDVTYFHSHTGDSVLIIPEARNSKWRHMLEEIRAVVEKVHLQTVTIGLGEYVADIGDLSRSYRSAMQALSYKLTEGDNKILWIEDLEPKRSTEVDFGDLEDRLNQIVRSSNESDFELFQEETFIKIQSSKMTLDNLRMFLMELVLFYMRIIKEYELEIKWFTDNQDMYKAIEVYTTINEIRSFTDTIGKEVLESIGATRKTAMKVMVDASVKYLNDHYHEEVSLESVADFLHISPEYLSRLFKKEMDQTFIQYLTSLRLDAAKRLIEDTNYKNFEVAEAVGYNEPNYFSYVFKKHFGVSPSKYRKSIRGDI